MLFTLYCRWLLSAVAGTARALWVDVGNTELLLITALDAQVPVAVVGTAGVLVVDVGVSLPLAAIGRLWRS